MKANRPGASRTLLQYMLAAAFLFASGCAGESNQQTTDAADAVKAAGAVPGSAILEPLDGAEVQGPVVRLVLSVQNLELAPAGDTRPGSGHHHLFINVPVVAPGEGIPAGVPGIVHLGQAQTSYELTNLTPGEYTIIPVLGDLAHRRIEPQVLDTLRFRVR